MTSPALSSPSLSSPAVEQNSLVKKALETVNIGDSVQFRPANGGEPQLMRIASIGKHKKDATAPRLFVGEPRFGKQKRCLETQVMRVITRSVDDPEDWIDENYNPDKK